jgi:hypothetical protein
LVTGPGSTYWRFSEFLFPFWSQPPNGEFGSHMHASSGADCILVGETRRRAG